MNQPTITLTVQGTIDLVHTTKTNDIYCKFGFACGSDWEAIYGSKAGVSHSAQSNNHSETVLNYPIGITLRSPTPFGWPQVVLAIYGINNFGNDMVVGYGAVHIPATSGKHSIKIPMFSPEPETAMQKIGAFFTGLYPELIDTNLVAQGTNRDVLKTCSDGYILVTLNIVISDLSALNMKAQ